MKSIFRKWFGGEPENTEKQENTNKARTLVKNSETGKYEWSEGVSPLPTTMEELTYDNKQTVELTDVKIAVDVPEFITSNCYIVNVPGFNPKLIRSYNYYGPFSAVKTRGTTKIKKYDSSSVEVYLTKENYKQILSLKKGSSLGNIVVAVLDRFENPIFSIMLKSAKIENIHVPIHLDYNNSNTLMAYIELKHDEIKYSL